MSPLPLSKYRVLDLTHARAGPVLARQLADWGADVIKVESPGGDNELTGGRRGSDFQNLHRNKRSIVLDLKDEKGREIFYALAKTADVVLENFRPPVKQRLGVDYASLNRLNPALVYASISGFGEDGPLAERAGVDNIAQGMSGIMSVTGLPGQGPVRAGVALADVAAGLYGTIGVLTALLERETTGRGRWVQTSLLQAAVGLLDFQATRWLVDGHVAGQEGNHHPTGTPMGTFATADGYVNICAAGNAMFRTFCDLVGREAWKTDPRFATGEERFKHRDILVADVAEIVLTRSTAAWIEDLNRVGLPCGPIYAINEVFADPQVKHLKLSKTVDTADGPMELQGQSISLSGVEFEIRSPAPTRNAHAAELLAELGYAQDAVAELSHRWA